jgi:hypothetical protein
MDALAPLLSLVAATLNAGTPLLLAAIGVLVAERSGVVNLGVEGMMLVAAVLAFACVHITGSYLVGFGVGMLAGALLAVVSPAAVSESRMRRLAIAKYRSVNSGEVAASACRGRRSISIGVAPMVTRGRSSWRARWRPTVDLPQPGMPTREMEGLPATELLLTN